MKLHFTFLVGFIVIVTTGFTQTTTPFEKECRLAGGGGFANSFGNATGGPGIWLQMSYRLSKSFSVATEFENMYYKRPGYFQSSFNAKEVRKIYDNYISFLIKYHIPIQSKLQFNAVCGWTYRIQQETYFYNETNGTSQFLASRRSTYSNYAIPFILELYYPAGKVFQVGVRGKYNLNATGDDATYAAGLAIAMKL